ncbi:MAG TPA: TonB-dependent receptor [Alphaproteobacteria bacterium]
MSRLRLLAIAGILYPAHIFAQTPLVEINEGQISPPADYQLVDHAENVRSGSLTVPSLAQTQERFARIPGAANLVPSEKYSKEYAVGFKDMLANTPGVFVQQRYGEESRLSIRGSGIGRAIHLRGINILQDGVPFNLADGSGDFQEIDPLSSRAIEVYKGSNGMQYGASSLGGAINVITPTGHTATARNTFRTEGGSFGTLRTNATAARVYGDTDVFASVTAMTSDGWRDQSQQKKARFNGNIGHRINDTTETRFYLSYNNLGQDVPGTLSLRNALDNPKMAPLNNNRNDYARDIKSVRLANKTSFILGDKVLDVGIYGAFKDLFHPISIVVDQESQTYGGFARLTGHGQVADHRNDYTLTLNGMAGKIDALVWTNVRGSRGVKTGDSDQLASQIDLYGENQFYILPQWSLVTGLQLLHAERDFTNNLNQAANDKKNFDAINPKLGTVWDFDKNAQFFANISRSSEVPIFSDLVQTPIVGFVPLDMQEAWTTEMGVRGQRDRLAWDVTAYRSWIDGELLNYTTDPSIPTATFNAGDTIHQGIELGFDMDIGREIVGPRHKLILRQTYNLNDFRFQDDLQYGDNRIAGTPVHQYRAELRYEHSDQWSVTPNFEAVPGGGYVDHANHLKAPGYAVVGVNATTRIKEGVDFYIDANNLLDKRYVSNYSTITNANVVGTEVFYPGEGRSVFAGVKVSF